MSKKMLQQELAPIHMKRDGDDLVIRLENLYRVKGTPSSTGKSFKIASLKGNPVFWLPDSENVDAVNCEDYPLAIKLWAIRRRKKRKEQEKEASAAVAETSELNV